MVTLGFAICSRFVPAVISEVVCYIPIQDISYDCFKIDFHCVRKSTVFDACTESININQIKVSENQFSRLVSPIIIIIEEA